MFSLRVKERLSNLDGERRTQSWLAEQLRVSNETVSKWLRGGWPEAERLQSIAATLKCPAGYLLGDQEDPVIAEATRLLLELTPAGRRTALAGIIALHATLPKADPPKK